MMVMSRVLLSRGGPDTRTADPGASGAAQQFDRNGPRFAAWPIACAVLSFSRCASLKHRPDRGPARRIVKLTFTRSVCNPGFHFGRIVPKRLRTEPDGSGADHATPPQP